MELLDRFGETIEFNLELKVGAVAAYDGIEDIVISALEERGLMDRMLLSCFEDTVLERVRGPVRDGPAGGPRLPEGACGYPGSSGTRRGGGHQSAMPFDQ